MDWKQNETVDVISTPAMHEGQGAVTRRRFFRDSTKLPVSIEVWELPPGSSEGLPRPTKERGPRGVLLLHRRPWGHVDGRRGTIR